MNYLGEVKEFWIGWITLRAIMPQLKKKKKKKFVTDCILLLC